MAILAGKRYVCSTCGTEMLVTRGSDSGLTCCDQPMHLRGTPATPRDAAEPPAPAPPAPEERV
jgi:hypothetical protein